MVDLLPALKNIFENDDITKGGTKSKQKVYVFYGNFDLFLANLQQFRNYPYIFLDCDGETDMATSRESDNYSDSYMQYLNVKGYIGVRHSGKDYTVNYTGDTNEWGILELTEEVRRILYTNKTILSPHSEQETITNGQQTNYTYRRIVDFNSTNTTRLVVEFTIEYFRMRDFFPNMEMKYSH